MSRTEKRWVAVKALAIRAAIKERESRPTDRTGKRRCRSRILHRSLSVRVEGDDCNGRPVAGWSAPAPGMVLARPLIQRMARRQHVPVLTGMALGRRDV